MTHNRVAGMADAFEQAGMSGAYDRAGSPNIRCVRFVRKGMDARGVAR